MSNKPDKVLILNSPGPSSGVLRYVGEWDGVVVYTTAPRVTAWTMIVSILRLIYSVLCWVGRHTSADAQRYYLLWIWAKILEGICFILKQAAKI